MPELSARERKAAVTQLGRICARKPERSALLTTALLRWPEGFGPPVLDTALELGESVVLAVEEALDLDESNSAAARLADALEPHLPWPTVSLRHVALTVLLSVTSRARARGDVPDAALATRLMNLSTRLHEAGQSEDAVSASEEALKIFQDDASGTIPNDHLLSLLTNLLVQLIDIGRLERAEGVIRYAYALLEALLEQDMGEGLEVHRARLLSNAALVRFRQGSMEDALVDTEKAIALFEPLVEGGAGHLRLELSRTLVNHSLMLAHIAQPERAAEQAARAVEQARRVVEGEPDQGQPELALALESLAERARTLGQREVALARSSEAIALYERLTRRGTMSFARRLAASLSNHAVYLTEAGRADDLLALARRALDVLEQERQRHPESVVEELPIAYVTYAGALLDEERLAEAAEALEKASDAFTRCRSLGSGLRACATTANLIDVRERLADASGAAELRAATLRALDGLPPEEIAAIPGLAAQIRAKCQTVDKVHE